MIILAFGAYVLKILGSGPSGLYITWTLFAKGQAIREVAREQVPRHSAWIQEKGSQIYGIFWES